MTIFRFALIRIIRNPLTILLGLIIPIGLMLVPGMWEEGGRGYYWIAFTLLLSAFPLTRGLQTDMRERAVMRIMSTPTKTVTYLWQNLVACMVPLIFQIIFICAFGMIRYDWTFEVASMLGVLYILFAMTAIGLAYAWAFLFKNKEGETGSAIMMSLMIFATMFGIFFPVDQLDGWQGVMGMLFPTYWISVGIEELLYVGRFNSEMLIPMGVLMLFTALFLFYGSKRGAH